ncbi:tetratricopeptide repeat protein [Bradyrhizobium sp. 21]|uniref:tetratricopeptide repeat protein n=1 Tax=Bradyrhizobium sp. 21 TaxID=2782666 RepID=UPI001FFA27D9|nr:tetratricopeptide repeat protein [Bradyrhizobium sp. 21]MCK1384781.1 tetratricopeptide repeat protein [Bradyrhizobium sp. 21]
MRQVEPVKFVRFEQSGSAFSDISAIDDMRMRVRHLVYAWLGYGLGEILCQQAGLNSESLDVTVDPDIAAAFASYQWSPSGGSTQFIPYFQLSSPPSQGVVYRWSVPDSAPSFESVKAWNFTGCPAYLPSVQVLQLFSTCSIAAEFEASLENYRDAIAQGVRPRPLELIRLPEAIAKASRTIRQKAGLLIPDTLVYRPLWRSAFPDLPLPERGAWDGPPLIEDFSRSRNVEIFYFDHTRNETSDIAVDPNSLISDDDLERTLTSRWLRDIVAAQLAGALPWAEFEKAIHLFGHGDDTIVKKLQVGQLGGKVADVARNAKEKADRIADAIAVGGEVPSLPEAVRIAQICFQYKLWDEAERLYRLAAEAAVKANDAETELKSLGMLGTTLMKLGRRIEARVEFLRAIAVCEALHASTPSRDTFRVLCAAHQGYFGAFPNEEDDLPGLYKRFIERFNGKIDDDAQIELAKLQYDGANVLLGRHNFRESLEQFKIVISRLKKLRNHTFNVSRLYSETLFSIANCREQLGDIPTARSSFKDLLIRLSREKERHNELRDWTAHVEDIVRNRLKETDKSDRHSEASGDI